MGERSREASEASIVELKLFRFANAFKTVRERRILTIPERPAGSLKAVDCARRRNGAAGVRVMRPLQSPMCWTGHVSRTERRPRLEAFSADIVGPGASTVTASLSQAVTYTFRPSGLSATA